MSKVIEGNRNLIQSIRSCSICGENDEDNLFLIFGKNEWICRDCLNESNEYEECVSYKKENQRIAHETYDVIENDDGRYYCKKHKGDGDDPPSEDIKDYIEKVNKD